MAPTNSTFLNTWTPSPLVLAGLIPGKHITGKNSKKYLFFGVLQKRRINLEEDTEIAMNASELLDESNNSEIFSLDFPLGKSKVFNNYILMILLASEFNEEDDKSSNYSQPDGPVTYNLRPNFSEILSSTPENFALNNYVPNNMNTKEVFYKFISYR